MHVMASFCSLGEIQEPPNVYHENTVCLCSSFSYPVALYMLFLSEPLAMHLLYICELCML